MKRLAATFALATLFLATAAQAETLREKFDKTYNLKPGSRFTLENTNGSVDITSWDKPQVRIEAEKVVRTRDSDRAAEVMKRMQIRVTPTADSLRVETISPEDDAGFLHWLAGMSADTSVSYRITVPRNVNLGIETVNGAVEATDINGQLSFQTVNGKIDIERASGTFTVETVNGRINAQIRELSGNGRHRFETTNGAVTVELPDDAKAQLDVETTNGGIRTDFPITVHSTRDNALRGPINGGGPVLSIRTTNGSVKVAKGS